MKRKEIQSHFLPAFQGRARMKMSLVTMPEFCKTAIARTINGIRLPLLEVAKLSKSEAWTKFADRLISGCRAEMPVNAETERILKELREVLNL